MQRFTNAPFPLTPTLSLGEREKQRLRLGKFLQLSSCDVLESKVRPPRWGGLFCVRFTTGSRWSPVATAVMPLSGRKEVSPYLSKT